MGIRFVFFVDIFLLLPSFTSLFIFPFVFEASFLDILFWASMLNCTD